MTLGLDSTATWLGASEMGRRIAEFSWLDHPLGPIENWSRSLKTTIQIMLNSRYAMWMGWGSGLYFFCNDAYLPTVGIKQSWVLGTPARKVWAEVWSDVGPRVESVIQTGKPTWDESSLLILERSGFPEETYHTFSYSPIPDDSGNIGGMLCVVTEETARVIGKRRLAVLRELGVDLTGIHSEQRVMEAIPRRFSAYEKDLPFSLMYLLDADGRQARLSCSHGIGADNSLAQPTIDVDDEQCIWPAQRVISEKASILVEDLTTRIQELPAGPWPTPPQQAVVVPIARQGHERPAGFLVAGISSYRRFDDDYLGFIQLLAGQIGAGLSSARAYDEERQRAEVLAELDRAKTRLKADLTLRTSAEERQMFVSLVESSQDFIAMAALNGDVFYVNPAGRALLGLDGAEDVELASFRDYFPVAMQPILESTVLPKALTEGCWEGEFEFQHRHSGKLLPIYQTFFLIRGPQSNAPLCLAIVARDISAQKQAEAELRASEQRYRGLVHGLPAAVYTCDAQGRITLFNEAAVELWGRAPEIGKDSWCGSARIYRLDGTVLPLDQCPMAMALKHGRPVKGEEIIIERPDGTRRHVLPHPQPLLDAYGAVIGAINMLVDITERKVAEDALRASEEHLRLATQTGTLGVWDWDITHNRVTWTDSLYPIHGLAPGEFGGTAESFSQLVHPEDRQFVSQAIEAAVKGEAPFELEFRILRPSGEVVWIFTNAKVLREDGRAVRMVGATVDISERKRSEHALRESEERITQLVALMPAAIYTCDADGHITFFNRRAAELWGREPRRGAAGELFTGTYRLWQPDGTLVARDQTPMAAAVRSGQSVRNAEVIIERPDGTRVVVSANIEPLHDRYGRNSGAISVFQDISERKNAERELRDRNEAIQLLSETLEQLLRANDAETIVRNVFDKVAAHVGADSYFNFMVNGHGGPLELRSCFGVPDEIVEKISRLDSGQAICGAAAEAHQAIAANNIQNSDDEKVAFARSIGLQSYVCNPLMVGDNLFGTLAFASHSRRFFDVDHLEFLHIVSQYTAIALDRLRNAKALRSSEDQLADELTSMQQLHAMTTRLIAARDIPAALNEILDAVIAIQGADFGKVRVYNPALNGLEIVAQRGFEQSFIDRFRVVTVADDSASGMAIRTKSRVVIEDVETEADYSPGRSAAALGGYRAVQATPLISRSGDLLGMLLSHFRHPRRPTARELRFVDLYARQAADFIELLHTKQELHDSEERLRRQANELEQQLIASGRLVSLGEITASMAHEFNNPLGIVLGFVEDLLNSMPADDPIHRPLQIIDDEAQRCKRIIQDLMDYSRPHATHLIQTKIPDLISKTLKLIENRLYKQKIKLTTEIPADLPRLHADYQQLEQVMVNLYLNAIDAMPRGGELAISAQAHGSNGTGSVAIAVTDTGFGIDEETLARIFQPFYTAKKTRGLGLGLPICERIVKNHGGRIDVESQVGQGTTFKIIIPLTQGTA